MHLGVTEDHVSQEPLPGSHRLKGKITDAGADPEIIFTGSNPKASEASRKI